MGENFGDFGPILLLTSPLKGEERVTLALVPRAGRMGGRAFNSPFACFIIGG
jgi:hypothetical protein